MTGKELCRKYIDSLEHPNYNKYNSLGEWLFKEQTETGYPISLAYKSLKLENISEMELFIMIYSYLSLLTSHKIKSGMPYDGKRHHKTQENNRKILIDILEGRKLNLF